jgi:hypothetical protein
LYRISDNRPYSATYLEQLCGKGAHRNVIMTTTMWDEVCQDVGSLREKELKNQYWKLMIDCGAQVARFYGTTESAWEIIGRLPSTPQALQLQKEIVDKGKKLMETTLGPIRVPKEQNISRESMEEGGRPRRPLFASIKSILSRR